MFSSSRKKLAELEETGAPFSDHLDEAFKFVRLKLSDLESSEITKEESFSSETFHGNEEWLLRWLLKKLQGNEAARLDALAWRLLTHLIRHIPVRVVARLLEEKQCPKFITILSQTLEDACMKNTTRARPSVEAPEKTSTKKFSEKKSRKRRRSGEPITMDVESTTRDLSEAVVATISYFINPPARLNQVSCDSALASAELIKSVLRTTSEEAAKILGSWLTLCQSCFPTRDAPSFISHFVELWESRKLGTDALQSFSQHCTRPLLSLLLSLSEATGPDVTKLARSWKPQLDKLLALNVILPSKVSPAAREILIDAHVREDAAVGPILLETSIRSVGGSGRIRSSDAAWIKILFAALKAAMSTETTDIAKSHAAIEGMLELAIDYHIKLDDQELLRSIAHGYAFRNDEIHWDLVTTLLRLDSDVFLSSDSLLPQLLSHITAAAFKEDWEHIAGVVIDQITIPLMEAFAKARDLTGFVHHWHAQIVEFIHNHSSDNSRRLCAWEDSALQLAFRDNLESSLTLAQIVKLVDWIEAQLQVDGNESAAAAACVLLQAVSGSIDRRSEEIVDILDSRLSAMAFTEQTIKNLSSTPNQRFSWRRWTVPVNVVPRAARPAKQALAIWKACSVELSNCAKKSLEDMETYHAMRCACALWDAISGGYVLAADATDSLETLLLDFLARLDKYFAAFSKKVEDKHDPVHREPPHVKSTTLTTKGCGWYANSYVACMLEEYPRILEMIPRLKSSRQHILRKLLHIASMASSPGAGPPTLWAENEEHSMFPHIWNTALKNDKLLNNSAIITQIIEAMLQCTMKSSTDGDLPLACNIFVAKNLYFLPVELFSKHQRELIIQAWPPKPSSSGSFIPIIWKLKMNIMKEYTFYDGMSFQTLIDMAETLPELADLSEHQLRIMSLVPIFGEIVRRTIGHVLSSAKQPKSIAYLNEVSSYLMSQTKRRDRFIQVFTHARFDHMGIKLLDTVLRAFTDKVPHDVLDEKRLCKIKTSLKTALLSDLELLLDLEEQGSYRNKDDPELFLSCASDALDGAGVGESDLQSFISTALLYLKKTDKVNTNFRKKLESFLLTHAPEAAKGYSWSIEVPTAAGRLAIKKNVEAQIARTDAVKRPRVAYDMAVSIVDVLKNTAVNDVVETEDHRLCKLLALQYVIATCKDSRDGKNDRGLSAAYELLFKVLPSLKCIREFMLTCELMENIIYTKPHWISQYHVDGTLSAITAICSPNGPHIRSDCSGEVFAHLCALLHAVLSKHRSKIQDRLHLVLQSLQALLRCLFTPLAHTTSKFPQPPWLPSPAFPNKNLQPRHAERFARLVMLICEPSSGAFSHNNKNAATSLNSETDKAKRVAGQHMIYLLTHYIYLRSGMQLPAAYQEKLKPALWSILSTTSLETREAIAYDVDSQGGVLWGELLADWKSFGRYNGN